MFCLTFMVIYEWKQLKELMLDRMLTHAFIRKNLLQAKT